MKRSLWGLGGALLGLGWGHPDQPWLMALAIFLPVVWGWAPSRTAAALCSLGYYATASRGLPAGASEFFGMAAPVWAGWSLWIVATSVHALPWIVMWTSCQHARARRTPAVLLGTVLPPLGVVHWTHPLLAAGWLFPGVGTLGLIITLALPSMVLLRPRKALPMAMLMVAICNLLARPPLSLPGWSSRDTSFGGLQTGTSDFTEAYSRILFVNDLAREISAKSVLLLPETLLGHVTDATRKALDAASKELRAKGSAIIVGGELHSNNRMDNALFVLGTDAQVLRQRIPVPVAMWRPWASPSTRMHLFESGVARVGEKRVAFAICYEELLVFPLLWSLAQSPDLIIGASNSWWAKKTNISNIQEQSLKQWGRLYSIPVVRSRNF